jgi:cell division protease FtsH
VDLEAISCWTPGYSGAAPQLDNLINEAAIVAAAHHKTKNSIGWEEIDGNVDRIMFRLEKKSRHPVAKQNESVAYLEAGHVIVGALVPDYDQVQKMSIIPRWMVLWRFDFSFSSGISFGIWYVR